MQIKSRIIEGRKDRFEQKLEKAEARMGSLRSLQKHRCYPTT
jgi:hypothetical protein